MLDGMTDRHEPIRERDDLAHRVDSGEFDAALRPTSYDQALSEGPGQFFRLAAEVARGQFDPTEQWDQFVQALWEQVNAGFGLTADEDDPRVMAAWFDHPNDPAVVAWDRDPQDD